MLFFQRCDFLQHDDFELNEGRVIEVCISLFFELLQYLAENIGQMT